MIGDFRVFSTTIQPNGEFLCTNTSAKGVCTREEVVQNQAWSTNFFGNATAGYIFSCLSFDEILYRQSQV